MFRGSSTIAIFYLDRTRLLYWGSGNSPVVALNYPPQVLRDMTVADRGTLKTLLDAFVKQAHIAPSPVVFILSDSTYYYQQIAVDQNQVEAAVARFTDSIPFDELQTKRFTLEKNKYALAVPLGYYQTLQQLIEPMGFKVISVIPALFLGQQDVKQTLDVEVGKYILKNLDKLKSHSILSEGPVDEEKEASFTGETSKKKQSSIYILAGVFGVLMLVLVVMLLRR